MAFIRRQNRKVRETPGVYLPACLAGIAKLPRRGWILAVKRFDERQSQGAPADALRTGNQVGVAQFFRPGVFR